MYYQKSTFICSFGSGCHDYVHGTILEQIIVFVSPFSFNLLDKIPVFVIISLISCPHDIEKNYQLIFNQIQVCFDYFSSMFRITSSTFLQLKFVSIPEQLEKRKKTISDDWKLSTDKGAFIIK